MILSFFYFDIQSLPVHNDVFCILFQIDNTKKKKLQFLEKIHKFVAKNYF